MFFEKWMNIISNKKKVKCKIAAFLLVVSDLWTFEFWSNAENTCKLIFFIDLDIYCGTMFTLNCLHFLDISLIHTLSWTLCIFTLIIPQCLRSTDIYHLTLLNFTSTAEDTILNAWLYWWCPAVFPYSLVSPLWHLAKIGALKSWK